MVALMAPQQNPRTPNAPAPQSQILPQVPTDEQLAKYLPPTSRTETTAAGAAAAQQQVRQQRLGLRNRGRGRGSSVLYCALVCCVRM